MRKEDLSVPALLAEAVGILILIGYLVLQIYYGVAFHVSAIRVILNVILALLVYVGLTLLSNYPERVNSIPPELCKGKIRTWTLSMLRIEKLLFMAGLLAPCIADAFGVRIDGGYSLIVILFIAAVAVFFEYRILKKLRENQKK